MVNINVIISEDIHKQIKQITNTTYSPYYDSYLNDILSLTTRRNPYDNIISLTTRGNPNDLYKTNLYGKYNIF